ncbi:hypothetical protein OIU79_031159 [Salix purpurea]|uniref:Uncharacterized protein n=1 Tax=Salix purpurea TaxID=77065 RepID=A0A9Q0VAP6_SALPP|nr:hypothetical protein OIU79_031159 [Salix purpurea]
MKRDREIYINKSNNKSSRSETNMNRETSRTNPKTKLIKKKQAL